MADITFRFSQKRQILERLHNLAVDLIRTYAKEDLFVSHFLYFRHDPVKFQAYIYEHFRPQKARITICARNEIDWRQIGLPADVAWKVAPCYGTKYTIDRFDVRAANTYALVGSHGLQLPHSNPFVPNDPGVLPCIPQVCTM